MVLSHRDQLGKECALSTGGLDNYVCEPSSKACVRW